MAIKISTSTVKAAYVGTSRVKHIYLDKKLVFSDTVNLTITLETGVYSVQVKSTRVDGVVTTNTYTSTATIPLAYGSVVSMTATAKTGYTMNSYTLGITITTNVSYSYTATVNIYWTDVNLNYGGVQYGGSHGDKIGTFYYSTNNVNFYGPYSNEPWAGDTKFAYDSYLYLRSISPAPGFYLSSVNYNGGLVGSSGGTYAIKIGNGSYNADVNFAATTAYSSVSFNNAASISTNSLSRNAWSVSCNINIKVGACGAGTVIGTVPYQYRPSSAKTFTVNWAHNTNNGGVVNTAVITVNTNGNITANIDSRGEWSETVGGKWGSGTIIYSTQMAFTGSWSVI